MVAVCQPTLNRREAELPFGDLVVTSHFRPIHHIPPCLEVIRASVLILEIVGMPPHIAAQDWAAFASRNRFAHDGVVLIGCADNLELAAVDDQPGPTAAETADACRFELFFERIQI